MDKNEIHNPHVNVKFFKAEDVGPRIWGREILVAHVPGLYTGKLLLRKAGDVNYRKRSMQYHRIKNECSYLYSGELLFYYDSGDGKVSEKKLVAGDCVHIPPGAVHGEEAITDCVIFETSNPVFNDRMRVNEKYGLPSPVNSLPSTTLDEIEIR
ncbi:MAG: hypothetical protein AAB968_04965 [Patescibacteria group bacterium]